MVPTTVAQAAVPPGTIPFTAFDQAVFVALFIVFCGGVFLTLRWIIGSFRGIVIDNQKFLKELLDGQRLEDKEREERFADRSNILAEAIERQTAAFSILQQYIIAALGRMEGRIDSKTRPIPPGKKE